MINGEHAMKRKWWLYLIVLVIVSAAIYTWKEYNRKPPDLMYSTADAIVKAEALAAAFETDEAVANEKYLGKIIEVDGVIINVNATQSPVHIVIGNEDNMHNVGISLAGSKQNIHELKNGMTVTARGECTGFLMDVELNNAVIIKTKQ